MREVNDFVVRSEAKTDAMSGARPVDSCHYYSGIPHDHVAVTGNIS